MKILLAEDERLTRRSLQRELERMGHEVAATEDGVAAWEAFESEPYDLVVTDWEMPRMDGRELVKRIRGHDRRGYTYVIMLTGRTAKDDVVTGMEAGADDFVGKPWDREELRVRLSAGERIINLERRLDEQNQALESANAQMHHDLEAAAKIQQELLPTTLPQIRGLRFAWRYRPCEELGGDLLNVVPISEHAVAMYLADVSGHGVASSLVSVSVHRSLSVRNDRSSLILDQQDGANGERAAPPDEVASRLNALYPMPSNGGHFLTLVYATIDSKARTIEYCGAGHPGPVLCRRGEAACSLETDGFPIGIMNDADFVRTRLPLQVGDRLYLYSDAIMEAMNTDHELFGCPRIEAALGGATDLSLDESLDALIDATIAWQGSDRFNDDLSLLAVEVTDR
jgi:sigma-B regulation protein RsbU (phosphoserine phosphatase)